MAFSVITRKEAKEMDLKYYYVGPRKNGHDCPKFVSNYGCIECLYNQSQTPEYKRRQAAFRASDEGCFIRHQHHAKERDIEFLLSFDEWLTIWKNSGKYEQRGNVVGCYVMGRHGDTGPYSVDNVSIIPFYDNFQVPNQTGGTRGS